MNILAVDDEKLICWALKKSLESKCGHKVTVAHSGSEAITHINDNAYDAIITDINLPDINGLDIIKRVRETGIDAHVFVVSSHFSLKLVHDLAPYKVSRCFSKPFQIDDIISELSLLT